MKQILTYIMLAIACASLSSAAKAQSRYTITDLGTLGGSTSEARAINDSGQIVGYSYITGDSAYHVFLYSRGHMLDLGTLGGSDSFAYGINNSGQIVGHSTYTGNSAYHAFLYSGGSMLDLGTLGGFYSAADGINNRGQIVGSANITGNSAYHAFLYSGGHMLDLGTPGRFLQRSLWHQQQWANRRQCHRQQRLARLSLQWWAHARPRYPGRFLQRS